VVPDANGIRAKNLDAVERFFRNDGWKTRRTLWAADAVFEMPFERGGPVTLRGRDAIIAESDQTWAKFTRHDYFELAVYPAVDPEVFWVTVKSQTVGKKDGKPRIMELVNYLRVVDGLVVHRVEYFNPDAQPG
jgi:ketosteroid isomerase-like protein